MTDRLVDNIRKEHYLLDIFQHTKKAIYVEKAKKIIELVKEIYRHIEPSHFNGRIVVFFDIEGSINFLDDEKEALYDKTILNNSYSNIVFQLQNDEKELPLYWTNTNERDIDTLLATEKNFIAYVFDEKKEFFIVNNHQIEISNNFTCPSIFALQYHYLHEALQDYKTERIKNVSCEHFKKCWNEEKWIYLKNKPEDCMQKSLSEYLKNRVRGINVNREYNLGASKPVDLRVFWREANRAALIEMKWLGQSLKENGEIGTSYSNNRANEGMAQIKKYIDINNADNPITITKGYLVVIDGRRKGISRRKVNSISRSDGFYYRNKELNINDDKKYWETYPNIEKPIRMFVEPICDM
ncbi:MAG: hypothetical protein GXO49_01520 [Chlorobi bacterium]|nr:hypothetical protein [Chlorobiota bacterium]